MKNLLEKYLKDKNLKSSQFARIIDCNPGSVRNWRLGIKDPSPSYAWKIHKATKGEVPITYWGFTIINGKFRKIDDGPISVEGK